MSYFSSQALALGYAKHRPYFHPLVLNRVREYLHLEANVHTHSTSGVARDYRRSPWHIWPIR